MKWFASSFNNHVHFEVQHAKFELVSQNPGEWVHTYNVRWNLERDLVDELDVVDMYPAGSVHAEELESMYIRILSGSFRSRLLDLCVIDNDQVIASELRKLQCPRVTTSTIQVPT